MRCKPKQLTLPPSEAVSDLEVDILEYTLYLNWLSQWLKWVHWYCFLIQNPDHHLNKYLDCPVMATSWKRQTFDNDVFRFGLTWRCYDMGHEDVQVLAL